MKKPTHSNVVPTYDFEGKFAGYRFKCYIQPIEKKMDDKKLQKALNIKAEIDATTDKLRDLKYAESYLDESRAESVKTFKLAIIRKHVEPIYVDMPEHIAAEVMEHNKKRILCKLNELEEEFKGL